MKLRYMLSDAASPIAKPRILGAKSLRIPAPRISTISHIDDWNQHLWVIPIGADNKNLVNNIRTLSNADIVLPRLAPVDVSSMFISGQVTTKSCLLYTLTLPTIYSV
jgi:hypothetical protein